jgi:hypothetical protein
MGYGTWRRSHEPYKEHQDVKKSQLDA